MIVKKYDLFLLEKRISQISSRIEIEFAFDVIKTTHADDRSDFSKRGLPGDNQMSISNSEMNLFIDYFKKEIAEGIAKGEIENQTNFVIRSEDKELAMAIVAEKEDSTYWKLIIKTVFRESNFNSLKVGQDQLVYEK